MFRIVDHFSYMDTPSTAQRNHLKTAHGSILISANLGNGEVGGFEKIGREVVLKITRVAYQFTMDARSIVPSQYADSATALGRAAIAVKNCGGKNDTCARNPSVS